MILKEPSTDTELSVVDAQSSHLIRLMSTCLVRTSTKPTPYESLTTIFHAAYLFTPRCLYVHLSLSSKQVVLKTHTDYSRAG